jgi:hypothetical protein
MTATCQARSVAASQPQVFSGLTRVILGIYWLRRDQTVGIQPTDKKEGEAGDGVTR